MFVVAGCSGPLPNAVPLPLARSSPPVSQSSTPSSRDSIWNGKPAPSTYLHKQLDVIGCRWSFVFSFRAAYICIWKLLCSTRIGETHQWAQAHFLVSAGFITQGILYVTGYMAFQSERVRE